MIRASVPDIKGIIPLRMGHPKPGVPFRDIMPLLEDPVAFTAAMMHLAARVPEKPQAVVSIDALGPPFGVPLSLLIWGVPHVHARKMGKLPGPIIYRTYETEYGPDRLEMQRESIISRERPRTLIVDNALATGGSANAVYEMVTELGGTVMGVLCLMEIMAYKGRDRLSRLCDVHTLIEFHPGDP